jgi:uncharacterized protein (DUF58 family)
MKRFLQGRLKAWARRRQGMDVLPVTIHRRRLYILPTRAGIAFATLVAFMLIAGLNYANSFALFLTFLLTGFGLAAMHQCHRVLLNVTLQGAMPVSGFAGESVRIQLTLSNGSAFLRHQIEVSALGIVAVADLPARSAQPYELPLPAPKRGVIRIERLKLSTTYPFGLFRAWAWAHFPLEAIVYPRPRGALPMPGESGHQSGVRGRIGAGTEEWLGLRPFRDGDSPRQVDWKAYARGAALLVKEYSAAGSNLRLFDFAELSHLATEARLEQLSRWIVDAEARGEHYGLLISPHRFEADRGPQHHHRCLSALAIYRLERST